MKKDCKEDGLLIWGNLIWFGMMMTFIYFMEISAWWLLIIILIHFDPDKK